MKEEYRALTAEEQDQIEAFALVEGRKWKDVMTWQYWMRGIPVRDRTGKEYPALYGLRNTHGGTWLHRFRLPKKAA